MGIGERLRHADQWYSWSLFGFALAALFGGLTLYREFLRDARPRIEYHVLTHASVLDIREELGDLQILYGGVDIRRAEQSLRVAVIRVGNSGSEDIMRGYYDENDPLGVRVGGAAILRAEILGATSQYLRTTLTISQINDTTVTFSPIILESGEHFDVKLLLLHPETETPAITPIGKVARVPELILVDASQTSGPTFLRQVIGGDVWVQLVRMPIYLLALLLLGIVVIIPITFVSARVTVGKRKGIAKRYKEERGDRLTSLDERILNLYTSTRDWRVMEFADAVETSQFWEMFLLESDKRTFRRTALHLGVPVDPNGKPQPDPEVLSALRRLSDFVDPALESD